MTLGTGIIALIFFIAKSFFEGFFSNLGVSASEIFKEYFKEYSELPRKISTLEENVSNIEASIEDVNENFLIYDNNILELYTQLAPDASIKLELTNGLVIEKDAVQNMHVLAEPSWTQEDVIAKDLVNGKTYTAGELVNTPLLIPYENEKKQQVYFYGQYNTNYHWNGNCIINVYNNDQLVFVMDAEYYDGNLQDYRQAMISGNKEWIVSERLNEGSYNSGITKVYKKDRDIMKIFSDDALENKSIYNIIDFTSLLNNPIAEYIRLIK